MSGRTTAVGWSSILATWVAIVGGLISMFMAIRAYDRDIDARDELAKRQADEHVAASFRMMERFHEPSFVQIRSDFLEAYNRPDLGPCKFTDTGSPLSGQEYFTLVEFFDTAQYCVTAGLCDGEVMAQLLTPYANDWWPGLKERIGADRQREQAYQTERPFGFGLETLATRPREGLKTCSQITAEQGRRRPTVAPSRNDPSQGQ